MGHRVRVAAFALVATLAACHEETGQRIDDATIRLSSGTVTSATAEVAALVDRDTTTGVELGQPVAVTVQFDHDVEVRAVKLFLRGAVELSGPGLSSVTLSGDGEWLRAPVSGRVRGSSYSLTVTGVGGSATVGEVELWGGGLPRAPRDLARLGLASGSSHARFENARILRGSLAAATLQPAGAQEGQGCMRSRFSGLAPRAARRAWITYEANVQRAVVLSRSLNGAAPVGGFWIASGSERRTLMDEVDPEALTGEDEVQLCIPGGASGPVQVTGLRLVALLDDGTDHWDRETRRTLGAAADGDVATSAVLGAGRHVLGLDRPVSLDEDVAHVTEASEPQGQVGVLEPAGWNELGSVTWGAPAPLGLAGRTARSLHVDFGGAADGPGARVAELGLTGSGVGARVASPRIVVTYPPTTRVGGREVGERFGAKAFVAGWAESPSGPGIVEVGGARVGEGGVFGAEVERPIQATGAWSVVVRARFPDGSELTRTIDFDDDRQDEIDAARSTPPGSLVDRFGRENEIAWGEIDGAQGGKVKLGTDVEFEAPPGAVGAKTAIGISRKGSEVMPPLDAGMVNVTAPAHFAYRFLPKGQKFAKAVKVRIPYDPALLPEGTAPEEIQTWYYDDAAGRWQPLPRVEVARDTQRVTSETTHFTFMINAVLVLPDHPGPASFNPNSIKDLKAADPTANVDFVEPPQANNQGTAQLAFPIRLPKARGAYQPTLRLSYDSGGGNGWTGVGWSLPVSSVAVDTKYGVPFYDGSERYLLDGAQLVPGEAGSVTCVAGGPGRPYSARVEREYKRIVRCGTGTTDYWFEVTDRSGVLHLYGTSSLKRLQRPGGGAQIAEWYLDRVIDLNGNLTVYSYDFDAKEQRAWESETKPDPTVHGEQFTQAYLKGIRYSGKAPRTGSGVKDGLSDELGPYLVELRSERVGRGHRVRPDVISSARNGFKVVTRRRLASIGVSLIDGTGMHGIREYRLGYEVGYGGKSRIATIEVRGAAEPGMEAPKFYEQRLAYWNDAGDDGTSPFREPTRLPFTDGGDEQGLSRSESWGFGTHTFGGIGPATNAAISIGVRAGLNYSKSTNVSSFLDVNGDWLPDRLRTTKSGVAVRFNDGVAGQFSPLAPPSDPFAGQRISTIPIPTLGHSSTTSFNVALQARAYYFSASYGMSWFSSETPDFLMDADGDGLVDVVDKGKVLFNQPRNGNPLPGCTDPKNNPTTFCFDRTKYVRRIDATQPEMDLTADFSEDPEIAGALDEMEDELRPADVLVEWLAPYHGVVEISGSLSLPPTVVEQLDPAWDGVRLTLYKVEVTTDLNGLASYETTRVTEPIVIERKELNAPTPVYVPGVEIESGSRLYFLLSTLSNFPVAKPGPFPVEEVRFAPTVAYLDKPSTVAGFELHDPTGAPLYRFDSSADFRLAGSPMSAVTVPTDGTLEIDSTLVKVPCADHVRVCIQRFGPNDDVEDVSCRAQVAPAEHLWGTELPSDAQGPMPVPLTLSVKAGEKLVFRVETDLSIDPAAIDWDIKGRMTSICVADDGTCEPPPADQAEDYSFVADAFVPLHLPIDTYYHGPKLISARPSPIAPAPFVAEVPGVVTIINEFDRYQAGDWRTLDELAELFKDVIFAIRKHDGVILKGRFLDLLQGSLTVAVDPGDQIFFEAHFEKAYDREEWIRRCSFFSCQAPVHPAHVWSPRVSFTGLAGAEVAHPTVNETFDAVKVDRGPVGVVSSFGGGFHGWRYGVWGGPSDQDIDPKLFEPDPDSEAMSDDDEAAVNDGLDRLDPDDSSTKSDERKRAEWVAPLVPRRNGTYFGKSKPGLKPRVPAYVSRDGNVFVTQGTMHAARDGGYVEGGEEAGSGESIQARFRMGKMSRLSVGRSVTGGLNFFAGASIGGGETRSKADVRDMNGDGIADVVSSSEPGKVNVKLTDARYLDNRRSFGFGDKAAIQENRDLSVFVNLGVSDPIRAFLPESSVVASLMAMFPSPSGGLGVNLSSTTGELMDVNGDGLPDLVRRVPGERGFRVRLNLGTSFAAGEDVVPSGRWADDSTAASPLDDVTERLVSKINSGGGRRAMKALGILRGDTVRAVADSNMVRRTTAISINDNIGQGFGERIQATVNWESSIAATSVAMMDVNGDGLPDYVRKGAKDSQLLVMLNTGYGFGPVRAWSMEAWPGHVAKPWIRSKTWPGSMKTVLDWVAGSNASVDSIEANGSYSAIPTVGFVYTFSFPIWVLRLHFAFGADVTAKKVAGLDLSMQDVNGDGLPDHVLKAEYLKGKENSAVYARLAEQRKGNLLKSVTNPLGGSVELDYTRTAPTVDMAGSRWVLSTVVQRDGRGSAPGDGSLGGITEGHDIPTHYSYEGGYHDRAEREFLGFARVRRVQADNTTVVQTYRNENFAVKGLLVKEETWGADEKLFVVTQNEYATPAMRLDGTQLDCVGRAPFFIDTRDYCQSFDVDLTATTRTQYEGKGPAKDAEPAVAAVRTRQEFEYDEYGNVKKFTDHGDFVPAANGTDDLHPSDDVVATVTYASGDAAFGNYSVSRPKDVEVRNGTTLLRKRSATYDKNGNVDLFTAWHTGTDSVETNLDWNADGSLARFEAPSVNGRRYWISYVYDPVTRTYPVRIADVHGYFSTATYDLKYGEVETTTDVNKQTTTRVYDDFGRLETLEGPKRPGKTLIQVEFQSFPAAGGFAWAKTANKQADDSSIYTVVIVDGLKRPIQTKKTADVSKSVDDASVKLGWSVSGQVEFDVMGRVRKQGLTFFEDGGNVAFEDGAPLNPTVTEYDALGRPTRVESPLEPDFKSKLARPAAVTFTSYDIAPVPASRDPSGQAIPRLRTTVQDANGHVRAAYRAVADRVVAVEERPTETGTSQVTSYLYNPVGELTQIADAEGHPTTIAYDLLGRRTSIDNPDAGLTTFIYDAMGNMVRKQDANLLARGAFIRYEYDLDQLVGIRYPEGSATMDVKFEYGPPGAPGNGAGRITRVVDDAGEEAREYGTLGELVKTTRTLRPLKPLESPMVFVTEFDFDEYGRMNWIRYPDGEKVSYRYDRGGLLTFALGERPAIAQFPAAGEVYLAAMTYDEFGQRRYVKMGNGAVTKYGYHEENHRLEWLNTEAAGRTLQNLTYGYDPVGNVTHESNGLGAPTDDRSGDTNFEFRYDSLDRLEWAKGVALARPGVTDEFQANYGYSNIHNMTSNVQVHKVTTVTDLGTEVAYPPHTNHAFSYGYDSDRPHQATQIGDTFLTYDGNGNTSSECRDHADPTCSINRDHYRKYNWTEDNRLASVIDAGGKSITKFVYDAAGERVVKYGSGGASITIGQFFNVKGRTAATKHVFAGTTRLASKLLPPSLWSTTGPTLTSTVTTTSTTTTAVDGNLVGDGLPNTNGCIPSDYQPQKCPILPNGEPVVPYPFQDTKVRPATYYYHPDHLGSTSWVTDQNGKVHEHVEYFPYGQIWREPKSDRDGAGVKGQRFLFSGKELDEETGLYYFGARYYDPVRVRWASVDPVWLELAAPSAAPRGSGPTNDSGLGRAFVAEASEARHAYEKRLKLAPRSLSLFAYGNLNPLLFIDPDGLSSLEYDGVSHTLTLRTSEGQIVSSYPANNNTTTNSNGPWPNGTYTYSHRNPHPESGVNDSYGAQGIRVFTVPERPGMGVHAGRANVGGPNHPTLGCIRTNEAAMQQINTTHGTDPLTHITVVNNNPAAPQTGNAQ